MGGISSVSDSTRSFGNADIAERGLLIAAKTCILLGAIVGVAACQHSRQHLLLGSRMSQSPSQEVLNGICRAERSEYRPGERVTIDCESSQKGDLVRLTIRPYISNGTRSSVDLVSTGTSVSGSWIVPIDAKSAAYGIYIPNGENIGRLQDFIRVLEPDDLTVFKINHDRYRDLDVLTLDGGMSAEYAIEKAAENVLGGISHSWQVSAPGSGPNAVLSTPDFLDRSVRQTVAVYDELLGDSAPFENVVISTGIPSAPYISRSLNAPVLPLHFLVGTNSVSEVSAILESAHYAGYATYATLSHDPSVEEGVAWIKLLDLPTMYRDFIKKHMVKNVYLMGSENIDGGETKARRISGLGSGAPYGEGSIYLMYPETSADDHATLLNKLVDLEEFELVAEFEHIVDWESGIAPGLASTFAASICQDTRVNSVVSLTSRDLRDLYDIASYASAAYIARNRSIISAEHRDSVGFIMNPYLISHPTAEVWYGQVPIVYWQGNPAGETAARASKISREVVADYFPDFVDTPHKLLVNVSRNFAGPDFLKSFSLAASNHDWGAEQISFEGGGYDEVWNTSDGMHAPSERVSSRLLDEVSAKSFRDWSYSLQSLAYVDFTNIQKRIPGLKVDEKVCLNR